MNFPFSFVLCIKRKKIWGHLITTHIFSFPCQAQREPINFGYIRLVAELPHEHARVSQSLRTCDQSKVRSHGRCHQQ